MKNARQRTDPKVAARQVVAILGAAMVLLACKVVQSIQLREDGSGSLQIEAFLEGPELPMVPDVRAQLQKALAEDPKMKLVAEGPRDGGHFFHLERPFDAVSELDGSNSAFRWTIEAGEANPGGDPSPSFAALFKKRYRLEMDLGPEDFQGVPPSTYSLEVSLPGKVVETNGTRITSGRVGWDRLAPQGNGHLFVVAEQSKLPGPSEVANWFIERNRSRYFDDEAIAWLENGKLWVGNPLRGERHEIATVGESDRIQAGGGRLLHYRWDEHWSGAGTVDATVVDLASADDPEVLRSVVAPSLSPDGRHVVFGRFHDPQPQRGVDLDGSVSSSGLWMRDLDASTEELIAGELPLPRVPRNSRAGRDYAGVDTASWVSDQGTWSADGRTLYLERTLHGYRWITYATEASRRDWRPVQCGDQFDVNVISAVEERIFVNRARETDSYFDICRTDTNAVVARSLPGWATSFSSASVLDGSYSASGQLGLAVAGTSEEGWPKPPIRIVVGDEAVQKSVELPSDVELNYLSDLRWHPRKPLLLYGRALVDTGSGTVSLLDSGIKTASWVTAQRSVFPSLNATRTLILVLYWTIIGVVLTTLAFGLRRVVRTVATRRVARNRVRACWKCGKESDPGAKFCRNCGAPRNPSDESRT